MIDFVGTPPFLRVAELVAVEIMHFHTTHNNFIFRTIFRMKGVPITICQQREIVMGAW